MIAEPADNGLAGGREEPRSAAPERVDVSVLTPVRNEERRLDATLAAMRGQRFDGELEFLFMDGRSEDATRALLEEVAARDARFRILDNPERHTASGLNIGLRHARGTYVARMDAHTEYPPDYLARGVERLRRGDVEWVSGPQVPRGHGTWSRRVALALGTRLATGGSNRWQADLAGRGGEPVEIELETGVFTGIWRRETLERHGGWDEAWPINQDSELAARLRAQGGRIVCLPEMGAVYAPRDSLPALARQYGRYGMYRAKTARRHPESLRRAHLLMPALAVAGGLALTGPGPLRRPARAALGAYALTVGATSARAAGGRPTDALALPAVFAVMHGAWGLGFLAGAVRFGPPLEGLARAAGLAGR
jgi:succinoglycan biosynthesis protein ExoA